MDNIYTFYIVTNSLWINYFYIYWVVNVMGERPTPPEGKNYPGGNFSDKEMGYVVFCRECDWQDDGDSTKVNKKCPKCGNYRLGAYKKS